MLDWIKELEEKEIKRALEGDLQLVYDFCGMDVLCSLLENFPRMNLYISTKPLRQLQRLYIRKNFGKMPIKELAHKLGVSEKFVYSVIGDDYNKGG